MGRRSLRNIAAGLDLSSWLLGEDELPEPFTVEALFGRTAPLEIEVGTGKGLFLQHATSQFPDHDFLGVEIAGKYARFAAAKLASQECGNGKIVRGDALRLFHEVLPDQCAMAVHVYFPDPWWKKRHRKRRVMRIGFIQDVQRVLIDGGTLHFWTDVEEYFRATLQLIHKSTALDESVVPEPSSPEHDFDYRTHFERRMRFHNATIYRAQFQKRVAK